jgi:CRP-like cAMP-binding protein
MPNQSLVRYIQQVLPMPLQKAELLAEKFTYKEIAKGDFLLKEGKISNALYFLEEGCVRSFILDTNGDEVTTAIFLENSTVNDLISFFKRQPSKENFQVLTDCKTCFLTYDELQESFHGIPEFRELGRMMLINNYSRLRDRMLAMVQLTAEQRYLHLIQSQPTIFQHVPLKMLATYLGITDTSLSRIRKKATSKSSQ